MSWPRPRLPSRRAWFRAGLAVALLAPADPGGATGAALLELYFGPGETEWLKLETLRVRLDGLEVPLELPAAGTDPSQAVLSRPMAPGPHRLEVEAGLDGSSTVFTYVEGFRFRMQGKLDLDAQAGQVIGVQGRVLARSDVDVLWEDRYRLSLTSAAFPSDRAASVDLPAPAPASALAVAAPLETAAPGSDPPPPPPEASCALETVSFAFDRSSLGPRARAALDRFATCLAATQARVLLEGHCDVRGGAAYNQKLGERRAGSVAKYLRSHGVAKTRISLRSLGKSRPLCSEGREACHARNRRVEAVPPEDAEAAASRHVSSNR